jgi:cytochrome c-type biogenesis protein CcmH/NrfG
MTRPSRRALLIGVLAVGLLALGAWAWWRQPGVVEPPRPDLSGADPEAAELIEGARQEVLRAPRSARAWGRLGMVLRAHDFPEEANACFAEAERLDGGEPRWPYLRGLTLVLTDPGAGIPCLERAVGRAPDRPEPRLRLAEVLLEQGAQDEARRHLEGALALAPGHARARLGLARLAFAAEDWRAGLKHLEGCADDVHARKLCASLQAEAWHRLGERARAESALRRARALPEDAPWPDPFVAEVERLQAGLRVRLARADALARQGRGPEAVALLEGLVRAHPEHGPAWLLLGQVLLRARQAEPAERALTQAVRLAPETTEAWFGLGVARVLRGNARGAAAAFREVVRLKPDHTLGHYNLGLCLKERGDRAGAARELRRALRCQPDYEPARTALRQLGAGGE